MASLATITPIFSITSYFAILIFGTVGNILNLTTLLSKDFRTKSCLFYMICASSLDLFFSSFGIILRFSTEYFGNNSSLIIRGVCKARAYFLVCLPAMASTCILLTTFDRCISTLANARWQQLTSIWFAKRLFIITMLFLLTSSVFHLIIFDIRNGVCAPSSSFETILVAVYGNIFAFLIPNGGVLFFGSYTWINLRQLRSRIDPVCASNAQSRSARRMDRQMFCLTFAHASFSTVLSLQRGFTYTYTVITSSAQKSVERQQIEYLILQISVILYYVNFGVAFYVNYAFSMMFRKKVHRSVRLFMKRCLNIHE
ncbi:unnamed protein product [Adineta ricciae]|uniref:G-protein coupled receptors family 1 profile domain-containing protein n=1 Tax=Adineta ricciae TaxID=249248 RepID=A0A815LZ36_ADIRI|nr:unnamed protein product [Adineta ricciae]CAF1649090.1 unnamed protein product [Adineta ricciae]